MTNVHEYLASIKKDLTTFGMDCSNAGATGTRTVTKGTVTWVMLSFTGEPLIRAPRLALSGFVSLGIRKLPLIAAEELQEIIMRRNERGGTMTASNRPGEEWGKLLGDTAAVPAMLDRLLHHGHALIYGPRSWRTKTGSNGNAQLQRTKQSGCRARALADFRRRGLKQSSLNLLKRRFCNDQVAGLR
jgi:hypothetical protein